MTRRERVMAALAGKPVDRVPVSAWAHFFEKESPVDVFVKSMLDFQEKYDWDFMKIHSPFQYHLEDWGSVYTQSGKPGEWPVCVNYPIKEAADWKKLKVLDPHRGALGDMLDAVKKIKVGLKGEVPFIMTVFSPMMIANQLAGFNAGRTDFKKYYDSNRNLLAGALEVITETFCLFVTELKRIGVDGLFFATKEANDDFMTALEYQSFARPFDERILDVVSDCPFNMLHVCGDKIHLKEMADYPVTMIHWDAFTGHNPNYRDGKEIVQDRVAIGGGPNRVAMTKATTEKVKKDLKKTMEESDEHHFLLGPGCSVLIAETPEEYVQLIRDAPEQYKNY